LPGGFGAGAVMEATEKEGGADCEDAGREQEGGAQRIDLNAADMSAMVGKQDGVRCPFHTGYRFLPNAGSKYDYRVLAVVMVYLSA
jgi:hypothetical protein